MTFISRFALPALMAVSLATTATAAETGKSLYDRLGGKPALTAVVNELWAVASTDARIKVRFAHTNPKVFGSKLVDFLCQASGGPCKYHGKDMKTAHAGTHLTDADFNALAEDTVKAMDKFKVPAVEKNEVVAMLSSLKGDVVNH